VSARRRRYYYVEHRIFARSDLQCPAQLRIVYTGPVSQNNNNNNNIYQGLSPRRSGCVDGYNNIILLNAALTPQFKDPQVSPFAAKCRNSDDTPPAPARYHRYYDMRPVQRISYYSVEDMSAKIR